MANSLQIDTNNVIAGLGTFSYTMPAATVGIVQVSVQVQSTIPRDPGSALFSSQVSPQDSNLVIDIQKNAVSVASVGGITTNPTPSQPSMGVGARLSCVASDVISVVFSSSAAIDAQPNSVKSTVNLFIGA